MKRRSYRIIIITFLVLMAVILFYQILIGNPFYDAISPIVVYILVFLLAVFAVIAMVRDKKKGQKD